MFEKFSIRDVDSGGRGGEYPVQAGFGWTNGVREQTISGLQRDQAWSRSCRCRKRVAHILLGHQNSGVGASGIGNDIGDIPGDFSHL